MKVRRVEPNKVIKNSFRCLINNPFKKLRIGERYSNQQAHERTGEKTVHAKTTGTPVKDVALVCESGEFLARLLLLRLKMIQSEMFSNGIPMHRYQYH